LPKVAGVPSQLRQVFQNLIGNALKFAKPDTKPEIDLTAEYTDSMEFDAPAATQGAYHRITVQDNGIGFDQDYKEKIFTFPAIASQGRV
jgi:signal transduction histidine kinase